MAQLYRTFEAESQKSGKVFHELVGCRRRKLGLPVPAEEQVLPLRAQPSRSRAALDLLIDRDLDDDLQYPQVARTLALLRTERRIEELELAVDQQHPPLTTPTRQRLTDALAQELRCCDELNDS